MLLNLETVTPPTAEPLALAEVKEHLAIGFAQHDAMLTRIIRASREWMEAHLRRSLLTQTLRATYQIDLPTGARANAITYSVGRVPPLAFDLVRPPLIGSPTAVEIETDIAVWVPLSSAQDYAFDPGYESPRVWLRAGAIQKWSPANVLGNYVGVGSPKVRITYQAGYGADPAAIPYGIYQAMLAVCAHLYENRESNAPVPDDMAPEEFRIRYLL